MTFLSNYLQFRAKCVQTIFSQISKPKREKFSHVVTYKDKKCEANITKVLDAIARHGLFHDSTSNKGLHTIDNKLATPEQSHDLLNFRQIGQEAYESYVSYKFLHTASSNPPTRKKSLLTFTVTKAQKQRIKLVEHERKINQRYLKKQLAWLSKEGITDNIDSLLGPVSVTP